ncbi:hypothetical protein CQA66_01600 [Helicobacter aurati]|uniref:Uncharacterized protein n=1 Tax=Helicobacter aurati TaxID=137778 RepID=A0A3D8J8E6_9HELI|nr:hypothetical protein [Helicobacter aurati]RDU73386.1 hypothetical protein CQA66_01600 [Helicobacter aurati]
MKKILIRILGFWLGLSYYGVFANTNNMFFQSLTHRLESLSLDSKQHFDESFSTILQTYLTNLLQILSNKVEVDTKVSLTYSPLICKGDKRILCNLQSLTLADKNDGTDVFKLHNIQFFVNANNPTKVPIKIQINKIEYPDSLKNPRMHYFLPISYQYSGYIIYQDNKAICQETYLYKGQEWHVQIQQTYSLFSRFLGQNFFQTLHTLLTSTQLRDEFGDILGGTLSTQEQLTKFQNIYDISLSQYSLNIHGNIAKAFHYWKNMENTQPESMAIQELQKYLQTAKNFLNIPKADYPSELEAFKDSPATEKILLFANKGLETLESNINGTTKDITFNMTAKTKNPPLAIHSLSKLYTLFHTSATSAKKDDIVKNIIESFFSYYEIGISDQRMIR